MQAPVERADGQACVPGDLVQGGAEAVGGEMGLGSRETSAAYPVDREEFQVHVKEAATSQPGATYYISGARDFLTETVSVLSELGISKKNMKKDKFLGY